MPKSNSRSYADELLYSKGLSPQGIPTNSTGNNAIMNIRTNNFSNTMNVNRYQEPNKYKEFKFESSLRNEPINRERNGKNTSNSCYHSKGFVNYTSPHGHYFDTSLQNGGQTKIPTVKNKNKRTFSPVREYIRGNNSFYKLGGFYKGF